MSGRTAHTRGFTIVELIIAIIIIGVLSLLVINAVGGAQKKARDAVRADDAHLLVGQLISYNTAHDGLPKPNNYGESNANGYDTSGSGDWLPFLTSSTSGTLPKDPLNNESGDPFAANAKLTYFYTCFKKTDPGAPNTANDTGRLGYRIEDTGQIKTTDFNLEACKD
jgi:prepilin-type N-terminal cleavage/methylation domain-containing protein